jgi:hypothetical protein
MLKIVLVAAALAVVAVNAKFQNCDKCKNLVKTARAEKCGLETACNKVNPVNDFKAQACKDMLAKWEKKAKDYDQYLSAIKSSSSNKILKELTTTDSDTGKQTTQPTEDFFCVGIKKCKAPEVKVEKTAAEIAADNKAYQAGKAMEKQAKQDINEGMKFKGVKDEIAKKEAAIAAAANPAAPTLDGAAAGTQCKPKMQEDICKYLKMSKMESSKPDGNFGAWLCDQLSADTGCKQFCASGVAKINDPKSKCFKTPSIPKDDAKKANKGKCDDWENMKPCVQKYKCGVLAGKKKTEAKVQAAKAERADEMNAAVAQSKAMKFKATSTTLGLDKSNGLYQAFLKKPEQGFTIQVCEDGNDEKCAKKLDQCGMAGRPPLAACCTPFAIGVGKDLDAAKVEVAKAACAHAKDLSKKAEKANTSAGKMIDQEAKADRSGHVGKVVGQETRFLRVQAKGGYFCGGKGGCPRGVGLSVDCSVTNLKCGAGITCCNS